MLFGMAFAAGKFLMFSFEIISGFIMIKFILSIRPPDQFKVTSVMFSMAGLAFLIIIPGMQALFVFDPFRKIYMAIETSFWTDLLFQCMAFLTIG